MPHPSIFISYRVDDTQKEARLLNAELSTYFGPNAVFLDKKRLDPGMDWPKELESTVQNVKVLLVLIKKKGKWLGTSDEGIRRTDDSKDWVRREIEIGQAGGIIIIPVLIDRGELPSQKALPRSLQFLHNIQDHKISIDKWDSDFVQLCKKLEKHVAPASSDTETSGLLADYRLPEKLNPKEKYEAPYLGLQYFDRDAAPLFFGRTRELLDFFVLIENPTIRLLCLYGHSGVGKSSFLAAGALPRLEAFRQAHYERRRKTDGLGKQLENLRQLPKTPDKTPVYILDQVEEMFTDPFDGEKESFLEALRIALLAEPKATFVLGFRSDYFTDIDDLLTKIDSVREDLPLRQLEQTALVEAIEGVWRDPVLRKQYQIDLEAGFAEFLARDLPILQAKGFGATSIIQNRLLRLYTEARKRRTASEPLIRMRIDDYRELTLNARAEEELLDFQLQRLRDDGKTLNADEKTILEVLDRFVVDKPFAGTLLKNALDDKQKPLRDALCRVNLLAELSESEALRLSHDLLAPLVRQRYSRFLVDEAERLEIDNVRLRLREVRKYLLNVQFPEALAELNDASLRNVLPEEVWPLAFEMAFVFLQAQKRTEGVDVLLTCINHLTFAGLIPPAFPDNSFPDKQDCRALLRYLRICDPALFIRLEKRYFPVMIPIEGGKFDMGDVLGDREEQNETVHPVTLAPFQLSDAPTTWQQYALFCLAEARELPHDEGWGRAERPVINVSWYDAVEYSNWLSRTFSFPEVYRIDKNKKDPNNHSSDDNQKWSITYTGRAGGFRLPTESEWEFAAREGGHTVRFGNGKNTADPAEINFDASKQYRKPYSVIGDYRQKTTPVRHFSPNNLGLFDMSGNVWEWCADWYGDYPSQPQTNPTGPESGAYRVGRGGSWGYDPRHCRVAYRNNWLPDERHLNLGFRLAASSQ